MACRLLRKGGHNDCECISLYKVIAVEHNSPQHRTVRQRRWNICRYYVSSAGGDMFSQTGRRRVKNSWLPWNIRPCIACYPMRMHCGLIDVKLIVLFIIRDHFA